MADSTVAPDNKGIDLDNPEFNDVWRLISYTRQSVFMTGKAGSGKSTFLRHIVENTKKKCVVLAPTGIAAVNAGGVTLHSFFHIPFKPLLPDDPEFEIRHLRKRLKHNSEQRKLIKEVELVIIDEISMVRADMLDFIDKVLRVYSNNLREPFGGKQMLLVGDVFQLEPVVTSDARDILRQYYPNNYFFSARVFRDFPIVPIELRKIYRQSDLSFVEMLDRMRVGRPTAADFEALNARVLPPGDEAKGRKGGRDFVMTLATRRSMVDAINDENLARIRRKEVVYTGKISDVFPDNSLPSPMELTLKVGAQVVFVRNDFEGRWVNGTIGKVHSATARMLEIELENGSVHVVDPVVWENVEYRYDKATKKITERVLGTYTQFPIKLAWALTIHKCQGLTFSRAMIDMGGGAFAGGQGYVALSRCRSIEGLTLRSPLRPSDFFVNQAVVSFSESFNNRGVYERALSMARADDIFHRSCEAFNRGSYGEAVELFSQGQLIRNDLMHPAVRRLISFKLHGLDRAREEIARLNERLADDRRRFEELAEEYVSMGIDCFQDENYMPAIANFDKALSIAPTMVRAMLLKGAALVDCGEADEAEAVFKGVLEQEALNFDALFSLGKLYSDAGDYYQALDSLLAAESVNGQSAPLHDRLSTVYAAVGDERESQRHRQLAAKLRRR